jgi:hypothetical protein
MLTSSGRGTATSEQPWSPWLRNLWCQRSRVAVAVPPTRIGEQVEVTHIYECTLTSADAVAIATA